MSKIPYIFISYARRDNKVAAALTEVLRKNGIDYFLDTKDMDWGGDVEERVAIALARCSHVLVIISPASLKSPWVSYEVGQAKAMGKTILPFLTHPDLDIPIWLSRLNYLTDLDQARQFFRQLSDRSKVRGSNTGKTAPKEAPSHRSDPQERDRRREQRNRQIIDAMRQKPGVIDCSIFQLEDHSDKGYLLFVQFDEDMSSPAEMLSEIRNVIGELFPDVPYWGEAKFEEDDSVAFAFTYIDKYNRLFRS